MSPNNFCYTFTNWIILISGLACVGYITTELILSHFHFNSKFDGFDGVIKGYDQNHTFQNYSMYDGIGGLFDEYCEMIENKHIDFVRIDQLVLPSCKSRGMGGVPISINVFIGILFCLFCVRFGAYWKYSKNSTYELPSIILGIISIILFGVFFNLYLGYLFSTFMVHNVKNGHMAGYKSINHIRTNITNCNFDNDVSFVDCYCGIFNNSIVVDYVGIMQFEQCTTSFNPYLIGFAFSASMFVLSYVLATAELIRELRRSDETKKLINY